MSRLIDADALQIAFIEVGQANKRYKLGEFWELNGAEIKETIGAAPTIEERKTGRWIENTVVQGTTSGGTTVEHQYTCSECGALMGRKGDAYCYKCGAKMDLEEQNER